MKKLVSLTKVLNLVINGMPSILSTVLGANVPENRSFKPCYKWNAFNTPNIEEKVKSEDFEF